MLCERPQRNEKGKIDLTSQNWLRKIKYKKVRNKAPRSGFPVRTFHEVHLLSKDSRSITWSTGDLQHMQSFNLFPFPCVYKVAYLISRPGLPSNSAPGQQTTYLLSSLGLVQDER